MTDKDKRKRLLQKLVDQSDTPEEVLDNIAAREGTLKSGPRHVHDPKPDRLSRIRGSFASKKIADKARKQGAMLPKDHRDDAIKALKYAKQEREFGSPAVDKVKKSISDKFSKKAKKEALEKTGKTLLKGAGKTLLKGAGIAGAAYSALDQPAAGPDSGSLVDMFEGGHINKKTFDKLKKDPDFTKMDYSGDEDEIRDKFMRRLALSKKRK